MSLFFVVGAEQKWELLGAPAARKCMVVDVSLFNLMEVHETVAYS